MDTKCCLLVEAALQIFREHRERNNILSSQISEVTIIKTLLKIMDAFIGDYREMAKRSERREQNDDLNEGNEEESPLKNSQKYPSKLLLSSKESNRDENVL